MRRLDHRGREREREQRRDEVGEPPVDLSCTRERLMDGRRLAEHRLEKHLRLGNECRLRLEARERFDVARGLDERVVRNPGHRGVPAPPVHAEEERSRHLLRGRAQVHGTSAENDPLAAALVDRVVAADCLGMLVDEPAQTVALSLADLLVRCRDEEQVAGGPEAVPLQRCERDSGRGDVPLHVESAASPDLAVDDVTGPGVALPLGWIREHGVRVTEEGERGAVAA